NPQPSTHAVTEQVVTLDVLPWTSGKLGLGPGKARLSEPLAPGDTLESLLERQRARIPGFEEWVYDARERRIHEHCTLLVNGQAEYRRHTAEVEIEAMVYLQVEVAPAYGLLEAEWVVARAGEDPRIKAIVAWAPCEYGEQSRAYLERLVAISPLIRGVRRLIQGEPLGFARDPRFVRGVQLLPEYGL